MEFSIGNFGGKMHTGAVRSKNAADGEEVVIDKAPSEPLHITASQKKMAITLKKGVRAVVLEEISGEGTFERHFTLEAGSTLELLSIIGTETVKTDARHSLVLGDEANALCTFLLSGNVTHSAKSECTGTGSVSNLNVCAVSAGKENLISALLNEFLGRQGSGEILLKALVQDHAHADVSGKILIGPHGTGTDTYLTQDVLLLDPTAKANAVPGLEIRTNDVKASHSASVARITPEDLFYVESRGLERGEARKLFVMGFFGVAAEKSGGPEISERVMGWIEKIINKK